MKKIKAFQFFNKDYSVKEYTEVYKKLRLDIRYPANVKREEIFVKLLKKHKPKKIIDVGCGTGMPLIDIKKEDLISSGTIRRRIWFWSQKNLKRISLSDLVF